MPSLPTSLIVVGLVIAWLVVLVPMVARGRERVPENTEDSANMRVLRRGSKARRRPVLSRTAVMNSDSDSSEAWEADDGRDDVADERDNGGAEHVDETSSADDSHDSTDVREEVATARASMGAADRSDGYRARRRGSENAEPAAYDGAASTAYDAEPTRRSGAEDWNRTPAESTEYRRTPVRPGRGGFDPQVADRARAYRFRQRRRVALTLTLITIAGVVVGILGPQAGYIAAVGGGVLLVLYLAYLRRQVRIEEDIRRRREARAERSRQIRPGYRPSVAEQVYAHRTGGVPQPGETDGFRVQSHVHPSVPSSGYLAASYGEPVDLEDSDPAFDDLEYYRPAVARRRAG